MKKKTLLLLMTTFLMGSGAHASMSDVAKIVKGPDYPFVVSMKEQAGQPIKNRVTILNSGLAALKKRLDMIEKAKKSIELEYFLMLPTDGSIRLILHSLIKKAQEGVKVRILVDKGVKTWKLRQDYVKAMNVMCHRKTTCKPIAVRYYNYLRGLSALDFRDHRKMFIIDDKEVITGGRNLEDKYFDLDETYNFNDRDIHVEGPMASHMAEAFNKFWESKLTQKKIYKPSLLLEFRRLINFDSNVSKRLNELRVNDSDRDLRDSVMTAGAPLLDNSPVGSCEKLTFVSDKPGWKRFMIFGDSEYSRKDFLQVRLMHQALNKRAKEVEKSIIVSSTYLIATDDSLKTAVHLLNKGVDITLMSNSLMSSDGPLVSSKLYLEAPMWVEKGIKLFLHSGKMLEGTNPVKEGTVTSRWGTHAKTMVFDDHSFAISSFNMDNRSRFYNTEAGLFCENGPELTKSLMDNMQKRRNNSIQMIGKDKAVTSDGSPIDIYAGASQEKIEEMKSKDKLVKIRMLKDQL